MVAQTLQKVGTLNKNLALETNRAETLDRAEKNKTRDGRETKIRKWESEAVSKTRNTRS
jgi:hypothetical protein